MALVNTAVSDQPGGFCDSALCTKPTNQVIADRESVAVSAQKCGVLPISQQSTFVLASLVYHDYEGVAFRDEEKPRLQADLGSRTFLMLRNHGLLTLGRTIADAFLSMYVFESACQIQISAQAGGELTEVDPRIVSGAAQAMKVQTDSVGAAFVWPSLLRKLSASTRYKVNATLTYALHSETRRV
jgi:hypothetical protein